MSKIGLTPLKRFFGLLKVERQEIISVYVYALFNGLISLSLPLGIQAIINLITGGQVSTSWILLVVLVILGIAVSGVMQIMQLTITENIQQKIFARSAFEFAYRIPRLKLHALENSYVPELANRFFDTLSIQKGLSKILMDFSTASLQVVFGLLLLSFYHPIFIMFGALFVLIAYLIFRFTAPKGLKTSLVESSYKYEVAHWLEEVSRSLETFKLAGKTDLPMEKTDQVVSGYLKSRKSHFKTLVVQYINLVGFKVLIAAGLLIIGSLLVINEQMNIGQFVASEIIIIIVLGSVEKLIVSMETIYDVLTAIEKIGIITDIPLESDEGEKVNLNEDEGLSISLNNVSYTLNNSDFKLLNDINIHLDKGEKLLITGYEGSGKSLLLQLMAGLHENFKGTISYNGIPFPNWCKEDLRSHIGDSLSREDIFKATLMENITMGKKDSSLEKVQELAKIVGLKEFIESLPEGYNTMMMPEGKNLPKSTRLKIMLLRSLTNDPKLILLEDNFNQLNNTDKDNLLNYLFDSKITLIAVSNDERIAKRFSKVMVLKHGQIFAQGALKSLQKESWYNTVFQTR